MTASAAAKPSARKTPLPRLRSDLEVTRAGVDAAGYPRIVVSDPVRATYFQLAWPMSAAFEAWHEAANAEDVLAHLQADYGLAFSMDQLVELVQFAQGHLLTELDEEGGWRRYGARAKAGRHGLLMLIVHNYLFFRLPLLRPEPFLKACLPRLDFVFNGWFWALLAVIASASAGLALQQWAAIETATADVLGARSLAVYAGVLLVLKAVHEMGHGLTTVRHGCRVPSMGIAVMLGTPVLYTDTTDAWRLGRRSQRLAIVLAGVAAEMIVATVALALWPWLPDGLLRTICFAVVTSSLVSSIAINLNPFMRYDGYYGLSDWWEMPNLQPRAFALAFWRLREMLFDLREPPPERLPAQRQRLLIVYAVLTILYRVGLYLGIAAVVYHVGSKALGIVLGGFEVVVFMLLPIWHEMREWWRARDIILGRRRSLVSAAVAALVAVAVLVPWVGSIEAPVVLQAAREEPLYLPAAARIQSIRVAEGQQVRKGDLLFTAVSPDLIDELARVEAQRAMLRVLAARLNSSDRQRDDRLVIQGNLQQAEAKVASIAALIGQLQVRAPMDGLLVDLDPELAPGMWQDQKHPLARLVSLTGAMARGVLEDGGLGRVKEGSEALFVPEDVSQPVRRAVVRYISPAGTGRLAEPMLADKHGGGVAASEEHGETLLKHGGVDIALEADGAAPSTLMRGVVRISASAVSPASLAWNALCRLLVREQGF